MSVKLVILLYFVQCKLCRSSVGVQHLKIVPEPKVSSGMKNGSSAASGCSDHSTLQVLNFIQAGFELCFYMEEDQLKHLLEGRRELLQGVG